MSYGNGQCLTVRRVVRVQNGQPPCRDPLERTVTGKVSERTVKGSERTVKGRGKIIYTL